MSKENATTMSIQSSNSPSHVALQILLRVSATSSERRRVAGAVREKPAAVEPSRGLNSLSVRIAAMSLSSWLKRLLEPEKKLQIG
jgi:hypothetical protein